MDSVFTPYLAKIEDALRTFLPSDTNPQWQEQSFAALPACVSGVYFSQLIQPCRSLMDSGGKRWRPLLMVLCAHLAKECGRTTELSDEDIFLLAPLVEFVHTASLIHDDIEDSAGMRRGKTAAHIQFGLDCALNAGSWLYFEAAVCIKKLRVSEAFKNTLYELYFTELRRLHLGQAMDILWHNTPELVPSVEEYTNMVRCKTGTLASLAVQTGIVGGGGSAQEAREAGRIAAAVGEGFQILDDVQNLTTGNPGKKRGDDIVEGKKSLPVLIHIAEHPCDAERIARCFEAAGREGIASPSVEECISILDSGGSLKKAAESGRACILENAARLTEVLGGSGGGESAGLIKKLFADMIRAEGLIP